VEEPEAGLKSWKIRSRASLYAASRSSIVMFLLSFLTMVGGPVREAVEEDRDEVESDGKVSGALGLKGSGTTPTPFGVEAWEWEVAEDEVAEGGSDSPGVPLSCEGSAGVTEAEAKASIPGVMRLVDGSLRMILNIGAALAPPEAPVPTPPMIEDVEAEAETLRDEGAVFAPVLPLLPVEGVVVSVVTGLELPLLVDTVVGDGSVSLGLDWKGLNTGTGAAGMRTASRKGGI